ncbi:ribosomal RNA small subunit methyltransferase H [Bombiscardovia apis]|uniref:Ribosomal RNA small subunit methyltransferase H n=1 Tax=Bombiscardovia apis TaxID=2932182 RepID=A0ABN6SFT0_9BIFI|nr:16S rRNA (cytosine(1402)-N(4))-methyltransferase RsmH [Bombiscardovia apis]BDR54388.1 ribosomal RNA small subunit methyltransferase H [Bombiscardovia apis]
MAQTINSTREHELDTLSSIHQPVLLEECVDLVSAALSDPGSVVVDCTLGLAGHATAFLKAAPSARLIGIDRDSEALALAGERMRKEGLSERFQPVHAAFDQLSDILDDLGIARVNAVFMDLGLSSLQIDERDRGFSYSQDAPLDMRMDSSQELTAQQILATYSLDELTAIFKEYGEERFARKIARRIVETRDAQPLTTSSQLDQLVDACIPKAHRAPGNPAKRVFQALRIEVNGELDKLTSTLPQAARHLSVGGRLVVESYHSLEDRAVKRFMASGLKVDLPQGLPIVPKEAQPIFTDLTHGARKADAEQIAFNPRSASVRLRAIELTRPIPADRAQQWNANTYNRNSQHHTGRK